jgi:ribosome-binding protein aMBF1 (putative translation factor)
MVSKKQALENIKIMDKELKSLYREIKAQKKSEYNDSFGNAILLLRKQKGWTSKELSAKVKKSKTYISQLERGMTLPCSTLLKQLAKVFKCDYELLKDCLENDKINKTRKDFNKKYRKK